MIRGLAAEVPRPRRIDTASVPDQARLRRCSSSRYSTYSSSLRLASGPAATPIRHLCASVAALLALVATAPAAAQDDEEGPPPAHAYRIEVRLDPAAHVLEGTERIHWTNESRVPATDLYFHLYLNAFENDNTVFMRENGGSFRGDASSTRGSCTVSGLRIAGGADLLPRARTDLVRDDRTQMRVPLPAPVAPGASIDLEVSFRSQLPRVFARSGWEDEFHMVAQWFPKLARREPDGTWATFPYHGFGEFYADFARYELVLTTPAGWVVGATGEETDDTERGGGRVTRTFVADRVHDTAFVAWPHFEERTFTVSGVEVRVLFPPGYGPAVEQHVAVVRRGLRHYGRLYGQYPYENLTVVVPPLGADGAAGMEYPQLFLAGGPWFVVPGVHTPYPDEITAHELAHQWFQGLVATNEVRWPMLDEGLTQWASLDLLRVMHGQSRSAIDWGPISIDNFELMRQYSVRTRPPVPPPGLPAYAYDEWDYGRSVYARTALVMETVHRVWGREKFLRALGSYAREQRFRHPVPDDLFASFDRVYGPGFSDRVLRPALLRGETSDVRLTRVWSRRSGGRWRTDVVAQRGGTLAIPTWLELRDNQGRPTRMLWPAGERRLEVTHFSATKVVSAAVDPDRAILLDPSVIDNRRRTEGEPAGGALFARALFLLQALVGAAGP